MTSVVSYPDRGNYGDSKYRGNTSGHIIVDMLEQFYPSKNQPTQKIILDINEGSGTTGDVVAHMNKTRGIEEFLYHGFDLRDGHSFLSTDYIDLMGGKTADFSFSHMPYHDMIKYSGNMWGEGAHEDDTSHCASVDEFLEKSNVALLNQRESTSDNGGIYTTLIGDMKRQGRLWSFQSDFIKMLPKDELVNVVIKMQHNTQSGNRSYTGGFIPIMHEYLLIYKKRAKTLVQVSLELANDAKKTIAKTWRVYIRLAMIKLGGEARLSDIYDAVAGLLPKEATERNKNIKAKIRQQLQLHFTNVERGVWGI